MKKLSLKRAAWSVAEKLHAGLFNYMGRVGLIKFATAHSTVEFFSDGTGTTYSISAALPASYDASGYAVTSTVAFTLIGKPKTFPQFGSKRAIQTWAPISGVTEKGKGVPDYGGGASTWGDVPADAGQIILKAAEASPNHYSMKITFPDGEVHYLDVLVTSWELSAASNGAPVERMCDIQLCKMPVVVAVV